MSSSRATQTADELGCYACYSADEIYHKDAWLLLAAAAGPTARIRLGPCVARLSGSRPPQEQCSRSLRSVGVGLELLDHEPPDRFAQLLVVLGEDEVPALRGKVGLVHSAVAIVVSGSDAAGGVRKLPERLPKVNNRTSYFLLIRPPLGAVGRSAQPHPSSRIAALRAVSEDDTVRAVVLTSTHERVRLRRRQPRRVRRRRAAGSQALRHQALPGAVQAARRARQGWGPRDAAAAVCPGTVNSRTSTSYLVARALEDVPSSAIGESRETPQTSNRGATEPAIIKLRQGF